jgi:hypothetical protein
MFQLPETNHRSFDIGSRFFILLKFYLPKVTGYDFRKIARFESDGKEDRSDLTQPFWHEVNALQLFLPNAQRVKGDVGNLMKSELHIPKML